MPESMTVEAASYGWKDCGMDLRNRTYQHRLSELAMRVSDPWQFVTPDQPSIYIWRVHNERLVGHPFEMLGQFYQADVYLILSVSLTTDTRNKGTVPTSVHHVHVWVGKYASEDDYKAGFFWAARLDDKLQKRGIIHREIQGLESCQFKGYFCPVIYWRGGFDDSFLMKTVRGEMYGARLLKLYRPNAHSDFIIGKEVSCSVSELDPAFTFVLDTGRKLFIWHGNLTPSEEDLRCTRFVEKLRTDRGCTETEVEALDDDTEVDAHEFYTYLSKRSSESFEDEVTSSTLHREHTLSLKPHTRDLSYTLHKLSRDKRVSRYNVGFDFVKKGAHTRSELEKYPICFYGNKQEVFVLLNKKESREEGDLALQYGHEFLKTSALPLRELTVVKYKQDVPTLVPHLAVLKR